MKIGPWPIVSFGFMIGAAAFAYGYWHKYQPNMEYAASVEASANTFEKEAKTLPRTYENLNEAIRLVKEREATWQKVVATKTPPASLGAGGIDLNVSAYQLAVDSRTYRNNIQRAVNAQVKVGGVTVMTGPTVPGPDPEDGAGTILASYYNFPAIPFPVVIFDLGTITVRGTYEQIKRNVEAWSEMPNYLAVADGLQLSGTSPNLTGTYSVSMVGYLKGDKIYPGVPEGGAPVNPGPGGGAGNAPTRPGGGQAPGGPGARPGPPMNRAPQGGGDNRDN